jgi:hypothetical protein
MRELNMTRVAKGLIKSLKQAVAHSADGKAGVAKTKSFKGLVRSQVKTDKKFAEALLRQGIDNRRAAKEPHPHVRAARQSASQKSFQRDRIFAKASRTASSRHGIVGHSL